MAIGERIRFIRNLRGMTQKYLGTLVGFPEKTADIRMAQYEAGTRTPKEDLTNAVAGVLEVSPLALNVPDIDSYFGLMHTLFALEDLYGLTIEKKNNEVIFRIDPNKGKDAAVLREMIDAWAAIAEEYRSGKISKEEYDTWRYDYPQHDETQITAKIPSQEMSDVLLKKFKDRLKD
ncbi:MAG: helix-turn-helix transcriptional regulator [Clostridia bacterium]|nr:helix-turn-helix transcriptional regulator [Clostridia bacterium]